MNKALKSKKVQLVIAIAAALLLLVVAVAALSGSSDDTNNRAGEEQATVSPRDEMRKKLNTLIANGSAFTAEDHIKGDVPAGEYVFMPTTLGNGYYSEEDGTGNILDNENFDSFGYVYVHGAGDLQTDGGLIPVGNLSQLGVSGAKELFEILHEKPNYSESGYYKVGVDIPAGTYTLESYGEAYVSVLNGPVGKSEIVDNDNFNGSHTVKLTNGQYLSVSRAKIVAE